tara:strand:- start:1363 stop:2271 length:909 start_codon:yes stop_codon:yes gene_type:complete
MSQPSSKAVDNVNFPQFRSDLNDGLDALFTNNSGSGAPAALSNSAYGHYIDTSASDSAVFKIRDGSGPYRDVYKLEGNEVRLQGNITDTLPAIGSFDGLQEGTKKALLVDSAGTRSYGLAAPYRHHAQVLYVEDSDVTTNNRQGTITQNTYVSRKFNWVEFDTGEQVQVNESGSFGAVSANQNKSSTTTKVKLKAGTHFITAYATIYGVSTFVLRFYDASNSTYIGKPSLVQWAGNNSGAVDIAVATISTRATFTSDTDIQLHQIARRTRSTFGLGFGYDDMTTLTNANVEVVLAKMEIYTV